MPFRATRNGEKKFLRCERFGQIIHRPRLDGLDHERGRGVGGDHQRRQIGPLAANFAQQFIAAHAAQPGVGDDHEKTFVGEQAERLLGGFGGPHGVTFVREHGLERTTHVSFVVHNQHRWERLGHLIKGFGCDFAGKITVNFAPFPSTDSTRTVPPYSSTLCLTMARPRPVPFSLVVKYDSNTRSILSGAIPGPSSATEISTAWARSQPAVTKTFPDPSSASRAFCSRFAKISARWPRCISNDGNGPVNFFFNLMPVGTAAGKTCSMERPISSTTFNFSTRPSLNCA